MSGPTATPAAISVHPAATVAVAATQQQQQQWEHSGHPPADGVVVIHAPAAHDDAASAAPADGVAAEVAVAAPVAPQEVVLSYPISAKKIFLVGIPSIVGMLLSYVAQAVSMMYVGHLLGADALAGISVALYFLWTIGIYPGMGIVSMMDNLTSAEYGRNKNSPMMGVYTRRALIVTAVFCAPVMMIVMNAEAIMLVMFGTSHRPMVHQAALWMNYSILYLFPQLCVMLFSKFGQVQCIPNWPELASGVAALTVLTPMLNVFFIHHFGLVGSLLALSMVTWIQLTVLGCIVYTLPQLRLTWGSPDWAVICDLDGLGEAVQLAGPNMLFLALEGSAFGGTVLIAAAMGPIQAAAWTVMLHVRSSGWSSTYGISTGVAARIGNSLGANHPLQAERFAEMSVVLVIVASLSNSAVFLLWPHSILRLFTDDPDITAAMFTIVYLVPAMHMADCIQFVFQGIFAGAGRGQLGATIQLIFLCFLGLPLGYHLAITRGLMIEGLLIGMTVAMIGAVPVFVAVLRRFDWKAMAWRASKEGTSADFDETSDNIRHVNMRHVDIEGLKKTGTELMYVADSVVDLTADMAGGAVSVAGKTFGVAADAAKFIGGHTVSIVGKTFDVAAGAARSASHLAGRTFNAAASAVGLELVHYAVAETQTESWPVAAAEAATADVAAPASAVGGECCARCRALLAESPAAAAVVALTDLSSSSAAAATAVPVQLLAPPPSLTSTSDVVPQHAAAAASATWSSSSAAPLPAAVTPAGADQAAAAPRVGVAVAPVVPVVPVVPVAATPAVAAAAATHDATPDNATTATPVTE